MLARMNFASTLAANQKFKLAATAVVARNSPQALVDFLLTRYTPSIEPDVYADLVGYAGSGLTWSGSDTQLQTKGAGLAHLVMGAAEYQVI
jgi:hypothetical protein